MNTKKYAQGGAGHPILPPTGYVPEQYYHYISLFIGRHV